MSPSSIAPPSHTRRGRAPHIAGLLLAGGRGSRFDPDGRTDKLLAAWRDQPIASHSAGFLSSACDPCFAILPPGKPELALLLESKGMHTVVSDKVHEGMGASLAAGVKAILERGQPDAIVIALADMPSIRCSSLSMLLDAWRQDDGRHLVAAPFFKGRRGHPVIFDARMFPQIMDLTGDRGAAVLLREVPILAVDIDDPGVLRDVDRAEDLASLNQSSVQDLNDLSCKQHEPRP